MNARIGEWIAAGPVITDGAWGTELQARGLGPGECPDAWNLTRGNEVAAVAAAYADAGSRVVLTNTFRANRIALEGYGLSGEVAAINRAGVELSRSGAAGRSLVFASIGPSGKLLTSGEVDADALRAAFSEQARALADSGADAIVVETMSDPDEAVIAVEAAKATGIPVVGCMVFDSGRNKDRTMMGTTPEQAVARLEAAGADVVGANCGCGIEAYVAVAERIRAATKLAVWIKANAGLPEVIDGRVTYRMTAGEFALHARKLAAAGVNFIGGCCGTTPETIRSVVRTCG